MNFSTNKCLFVAAILSVIFLSATALNAGAAEKDNLIDFKKINAALKCADDTAISKTLEEALSKLSEAEKNLTAFEYLFIDGKLRLGARYYEKFIKNIYEQKNADISIFLKNIAKLYSTFANYAYENDILGMPPEGGDKFADKLLLILYDKYSAAYNMNKKDYETKKTSSDFVSYLEKKVKAAPCILPSADAISATVSEEISKLIKDPKKIELISRRLLLLLMVYKNISPASNNFQKELVKSVILKNHPEGLFKKAAASE